MARDVPSRAALVALTVAVAALALWWAAPALTYSSTVPPPVLSEARLRELKGNIPTSGIHGIGSTLRVDGLEIQLLGGYMNERQLVLFLRLSPPARFVLSETTLRDQFGRVYAARSSFADAETGEHIVWFEAPQPPLTVTGARLWLESSRLERGAGPERVQVAVSLPFVLTSSNSAWGSFLLGTAINYAVMAAVAVAYVSLFYLGALVTRRGAPRSVARGVRDGVLFLALALPTYVLIATSFRHVPSFSGRERELESYFTYLTVTRAALLVVWGAGLVTSFGRTLVVGKGAGSAVGSALAVLVFIVLTLPLVEFANACYIGAGFLLRPNC